MKPCTVTVVFVRQFSIFRQGYAVPCENCLSFSIVYRFACGSECEVCSHLPPLIGASATPPPASSIIESRINIRGPQVFCSFIALSTSLLNPCPFRGITCRGGSPPVKLNASPQAALFAAN